MLRFTHRLAEHLQSSAQHNSPVFKKEKSHSFWVRRWRTFCQRGWLGKALTLVGYGSAGLGAYIATCLFVRTMHQPTVDALFTSGEDYTLDEWRTVEPTLRPGDIILLRGNGLMSWTIATLQFMFSFMHPAALRYSHVAVVVAPAVVEYVDDDAVEEKNAAGSPFKVDRLEDVFEEAASIASAQHATPTTPASAQRSVHEQLQAEEAALRRRPLVRRGAIILEAMDNKDYDLADVTGKVTHDTVQIVEATRRIFSTTPDNVHAYRYFSVRRLVNYEHTPERQERLKRFCVESEGRTMDSSLLYPLAFLHSKLHTLTHPLRHNVSGEVSCSELIVELYQYLGIVQRRWRWVPLDVASALTTASVVSPPSSSTSSTDNTQQQQQRQQQTVVAPTQADATQDRSAKSLHVYDYVYGRVNDRAKQPVMSRDRSSLPDASTIENGGRLLLPELRARSAVAPLQPIWPEVDKLKEVSDFFGKTLTGEAAETARTKLKTRVTATYVRNPEVPTPALRAGDIAQGVDGASYQLQWYYAHNSVATCPFQFTEGAGESVLDFAMNVGLGPELYMHIDRAGDASKWILEDP